MNRIIKIGEKYHVQYKFLFFFWRDVLYVKHGGNCLYYSTFIHDTYDEALKFHQDNCNYKEVYKGKIIRSVVVQQQRGFTEVYWLKGYYIESMKKNIRSGDYGRYYDLYPYYSLDKMKKHIDDSKIKIKKEVISIFK